MRVKELFAFIRDRHDIYERRTAGLPKPWTRDKILQTYRFCNVYRELDKVTVWIRENWRDPHRDEPSVWFAMVVARLLNQPTTLQAVGYPTPFKPVQMLKILQCRKAAGELVFNAAYIVSTNGRTMPKDVYVVEQVLAPLWAARKQAPQGATLQEFHAWLQTFQGMGSFMAAQVVADVKFTDLLKDAPDWWTWAAPGPGSMRGLNRVCGYPADKSWKDGQVNHWFSTLQKLQSEIEPLIAKAKMPRLSAQDTQNCLCEFDKYERVRTGEGRPKQLYPGGA